MPRTALPRKHVVKFRFGYRLLPDQKSPAIGQIHTLMQDTGMTASDLAKAPGAAARSTIYNWIDGPTKRPRHDLLEASLRAMGYRFGIIPMDSKEARVMAPPIIKNFRLP